MQPDAVQGPFAPLKSVLAVADRVREFQPDLSRAKYRMNPASALLTAPTHELLLTVGME